MSPILGIIASSKQSAKPGAFESIATADVGAGGSTSIVFDLSSVSGYKHLQLRYISRNYDSPGYADGIFYYFNTDNTETNYYRHLLIGEGSGSPFAATANSFPIITIPAANQTAGAFAAGIIDIYDYASTTKTKSLRQIEGYDLNGGGAIMQRSSMWNSTSAINKITFERSGFTFGRYSQIALYGIKD
jgi:hypothetical protein